jgi:hypothetical protein
MINAYWEALEFELPPPPADHRWKRLIDTYLQSPCDFMPAKIAPTVPQDRYRMRPRSMAMLYSTRKRGTSPDSTRVSPGIADLNLETNRTA